METCSSLLEAFLKRAQNNLGLSFICDEDIATRVAAVGQTDLHSTRIGFVHLAEKMAQFAADGVKYRAKTKRGFAGPPT